MPPRSRGAASRSGTRRSAGSTGASRSSIGGRATDLKPLAWVDKESFQPVRLMYSEAGSPADVRFVGWGSPTGGDWAPRAIEVHAGGALRLRFTTEKASANPRLPELLLQ